MLGGESVQQGAVRDLVDRRRPAHPFLSIPLPGHLRPLSRREIHPGDHRLKGPPNVSHRPAGQGGRDTALQLPLTEFCRPVD